MTPSEAPAAGAAAQRGGLAKVNALVELSKPGVTRLVMVTTAAGAVIAPGAVDGRRLVACLVGTTLVVAAANAFNMLLERDSDGLMERTRTRPLPSGRLSPTTAAAFGIVTAATGLAIDAHFANALTAWLAAAALFSYVAMYTPLKRVTPLALHVGAIPGALPPVIGWAAMTDHVGAGAVALFALMFAWQLPHFLAIAIFRQAEYERAGVRVLPAVRGVGQTKVEIIVYSLVLVAASLGPVAVHIAGQAYLVFALLAGGGFFVWSLQGLEDDAGLKWARTLFFASMPYLVLTFGALVLGAS